MRIISNNQIWLLLLVKSFVYSYSIKNMKKLQCNCSLGGSCCVLIGFHSYLGLFEVQLHITCTDSDTTYNIDYSDVKIEKR